MLLQNIPFTIKGFTMVKAEWGIKRSCIACSAKFYDLKKTPPVCPKCGSVYEMIVSGRGRKSKASALSAGKVDVLDDLELTDDLETEIESDDVDVLEDDGDNDDGLGINERVLDDEESH